MDFFQSQGLLRLEWMLPARAAAFVPSPRGCCGTLASASAVT